MNSRWFPVDISEEEVAFGFVVATAPLGNRTVAVANLRPGLRAVKVRVSGETIHYLVCDERLAPLSSAARSLAELRTRFRDS
jgi:hypothetical protein